MASVFSLQLQPLGLRSRHSAPLLRTKELRYQSPVCCQGIHRNDHLHICSSEGPGNSRRDALVQILFSALSFPFLAKNASAETDTQQDFRTYEDEANKFRILVPHEWLVGTGDSTSFKSVTAFFPQEASDSNVSIAITGLGPDFTRLESFGNVDAFAESLVTGLDRSWQRPPGLSAKLLDSKAKNGFYYIEYTLQNPGERCRHVFSAIGMANNGWYNRLYTVTGQFMEDESEKFISQIKKVHLGRESAISKNSF